MLVLAAAVVLYVRLRPLSLDGVPPSRRAELTFRGDDGREHVYLHGYDGYLWARDSWTLPDALTASGAFSEGGSVSTARRQDGWIWLPPMPEKTEDAGESNAAEG
jgi:hypothetical protein